MYSLWHRGYGFAYCRVGCLRFFSVVYVSCLAIDGLKGLSGLKSYTFLYRGVFIISKPVPSWTSFRAGMGLGIKLDSWLYLDLYYCQFGGPIAGSSRFAGFSFGGRMGVYVYSC